MPRLTASGYWLIAANVLPLLGVLLLGWDTFALVMIYWCENVILGVINVLKMAFCSPDPTQVEEVLLAHAKDDKAREAIREFQKNSKVAGFVHQGSKLFMIPFFVFHYGMFCMGHGFFIVALLGQRDMVDMHGGPLQVFRGLFNAAEQAGLLWAVAGLAVSHLYSFVSNYLVGGEYRRTLVAILMMQPYARIVVLHIAILLGAFGAHALGSPVIVLVILIVGKTLLDLKFHDREHEKLEPLPVLSD